MKAFILLGIIALLGVSAAQAATTPRSEVLVTVTAFADAFNKGDMKAAAATTSPDGVAIVDDIAPHVWSGAGAFDAWGKALADSDKAQGISDDVVTSGKVVRVIIDADRAYVVQLADYAFKQKGVPMQETSRIVYSLQKGKTGWLITGFTWVAGTPQPAAAAAKK